MVVKQTNAQLFPSDTLRKDRIKGIVYTGLSGYGLSMAWLYQAWYSKKGLSTFHSFDDSREWLQMDKVGHGYTAYVLGRVGFEALSWSGVERKKAVYIGGSLGWVLLSSIEILDGFSEEWGFSWSDVAANTIGTGLFVGQEFAWKEQRILLKYSYSKSDYAKYRPNVLGSNWNERFLKDYNGQTYWLSLNLKSFVLKQTSFPDWLNLAVGYGADGMIGGHENPVKIEAEAMRAFKRQREFYLSLDIDLTRIKTRKKWLKAVLLAFNSVKIPAPALMLNESGEIQFHPVHF